MRAREVSVITCFTATAAALRLAKNVFIGSIQFVNFPAVFTIIGGLALGPVEGFIIGVMSFAFSDFLMGTVGPWTVYCSLAMGFAGFIVPFMHRIEGGSSLLGLSVCSYMSILAYDILSSVGFFALVAPLNVALTWAIIGLFLPSPYVFYPVGLMTEIVTVSIIVVVYPRIERIMKRGEAIGG